MKNKRVVKNFKKLKKSNFLFLKKSENFIQIYNLYYIQYILLKIDQLIHPIKFHVITRGLITNRSNMYVKNFCVIVIIANMEVI